MKRRPVDRRVLLEEARRHYDFFRRRPSVPAEVVEKAAERLRAAEAACESVDGESDAEGRVCGETT
ncbi:MAG: hypothetical protein ACREIV_13440 [Planctomycetaceae bacterium]